MTLHLDKNQISVIESGSNFIGFAKYLGMYSNSTELELINGTLSGLSSIRDFYFSDLLIENSISKENIKSYMILHKYPSLKSRQEHYYSNYLTAIQLNFDDNDCSNVFYLIRYSLNLNLKSETQLKDFLMERQSFFNKVISKRFQDFS